MPRLRPRRVGPIDPAARHESHCRQPGADAQALRHCNLTNLISDRSLKLRYCSSLYDPEKVSQNSD